MLADRHSTSEPPWVGWLVLLAATAVAIASAHDHAGAWNDGSRLATVESLVDRHTLAIDDSIFVVVPKENPPYANCDPNLFAHGTGDKLYIRGHYYSDKSPVPALLLAGVYQGWQWCTGWTARDHPRAFCYVMTLASSGLAYVAAVWCIYLLGQPLRLPMSLRLLLTLGVALATVAPTYARYVNNHIMLLGVAAVLFLRLAWVARECRPTSGLRLDARLLVIGSLAGLGYTMDLGAGPVLVICVGAVVTYRCRSAAALSTFVLGALPWLAAHHLVNYSIGGTFKPANAVPEYFDWPGCVFNEGNMTGAWNHSLGHFFEYAGGLLFGKRGFFFHNLPLLLFLPAAVVLLWRRPAETPEIICACCWCGGTWLAYSLTSNNYSGLCCSVRWFVPLLAPAYYVLGVFLRDDAPQRTGLAVLTGWGMFLAALMWHYGPWIRRFMPYAGFWPLCGAALASWLLCVYFGWRSNRATLQTSITKSASKREAA